MRHPVQDLCTPVPYAARIKFVNHQVLFHLEQCFILCVFPTSRAPHTVRPLHPPFTSVPASHGGGTDVAIGYRGFGQAPSGAYIWPFTLVKFDCCHEYGRHRATMRHRPGTSVRDDRLQQQHEWRNKCRRFAWTSRRSSRPWISRVGCAATGISLPFAFKSPSHRSYCRVHESGRFVVPMHMPPI